MKKLFFVANWKSHKTVKETQDWFSVFTQQIAGVNVENKEIIVCPSFTALSAASEIIKQSGLPIQLGVQNISPFPEGAFTGEISAEQAIEFASYVLIGHSERREHFGETDSMLSKKVEMAMHFGLTPIYFVQNVTTQVPEGVVFVAYEPVSAIGTGKPDSPENAERVARTIKDNTDVTRVLYGGSVTDENVSGFVTRPELDGVVPGKASLDPIVFADIVKQSVTS